MNVEELDYCSLDDDFSSTLNKSNVENSPQTHYSRLEWFTQLIKDVDRISYLFQFNFSLITLPYIKSSNLRKL